MPASNLAVLVSLLLLHEAISPAPTITTEAAEARVSVKTTETNRAASIAKGRMLFRIEKTN
jgi:hypothetical protein